MALGGVATGNIKAKLALIVAGIINNLGSISDAIAAVTNIGNRIVVVAVLLVTSVKNVTAKQMAAMLKSTGSVPRDEIEFPSISLNPDALNALAKHNPPANNTKTPQGIFAAVSQSSNLPPSPDGSANKTSTPINATEASLA